MDELVERLFRGRPIVSLATMDGGGLPHLVPMWARLEDGTVFIPTSSTTVKVRNLRRDDRAAVLVHETEGAMSLRGALLQGPMAIVEGEEARRRNRAIHEHYLPGVELARRAVTEYLSNDDVTLALTPAKVRTWDLSRLYEQDQD